MEKVVWTESASDNLHDIFNYLAQFSEPVAHRIAEGIWTKSQILFEFPEIGHFYKSTDNSTVRIMLYGHYRIIYGLTAREIQILGVFHQAIQFENHIQL